MTTDNRVVLDYTSRDYKAIRSMLVGLAQGFLPEWTTAGETGDFGTLLLELFAYNGDIMNYYIDRVGAEAFLGTANRRQSVMFIADMLGYNPLGQQAANVPLTFSWQWDTSATQVSNTVYRVIRTKVDNGVMSAEVESADAGVSIDVGQTIVLRSLASNSEDAIGSFIVDSVAPAAPPTPFIVSFLLDDEGGNTNIPDTAGVWIYAGPGTTISTGSVILIPKGTVVSSTPDDLGQSVVFELDYNVVLDSSIATRVPTPGYVGSSDPSTVFSVVTTGTATEGITVAPASIGVSKGIPNTDLTLGDLGVIDGSVKVYTKEGGAAIVWSRVENLAVAGPDQSVFSYYVDDEGLTHILFGDNASGRIPPVNSEIFVGYKVGVGVNANDLDVGTITTLNFDFATGEGVTVSNTASPTGGADIESIESMRFSVPRANAVRRRAVSLDDYESLTLQVPGVAKVLAYGDSYTSVFLRIASSAESRAYITDRTPYFKSGTGTIKVVTSQDHSSDLHPGDKVYLSTNNATGSYFIRKVWKAQPTNIVSIVSKELVIYAPGQIPGITATHSSARLVCATPHGLMPGQPVKVVGLGTPFDGVWIVGSVPDTERKVLTYHCPSWVYPVDTSLDAGILDYNVAIPVAAIASDTAALTAYSGLELVAPGVATKRYHPTAQPGDSASPNLSFSDPQMRSLIEAVEAYMSDKDIVGADVYAEPVEWTNVIVGVTVSVRSLYNRTSVKEAVKEAIKLVFDFDNVDFGRKITLGEVYRAALAVDGVEFVNIGSMYIGDTGFVVSDDLNSNGEPVDPGVLVPPVPGVGDIVTPLRNIPRLDPTTLTNDVWVTASGGLVNT